MYSRNLSHFERVAGAFVGCAILGFVVLCVLVGFQKGWFESKVPFFTELEESEGLRAGSSVQLAGIPIGEVSGIELTERNTLRVRFMVLSRFRSRIREGSRLQLIRPYVIGEKVLYLTTPVDSTPELAAGSLIPSEEVVGLTELLNGRKFMPYVQTLGAVFHELKLLADMVIQNKDSKKVVRVLESLPAFLNQVNRLTRELTLVASQVNEGENLRKVLRGLAMATESLSKSLPQLAEGTPQFTKDFTAMVGNLAIMTEEFKKVLPAISAVAPELPRSSHRLIEALDEAVVVMKAMQKSFLLRGSAREVREEEAEREKASRLPAQESPPKVAPEGH